MASPHFAVPLPQHDRLQIIDSLRGVALLGILLMNIPYFGMPYQFEMNISLRNEFSGPKYYTGWVVNLFFEGTMRGIFSMLFGAGCVLLMERLEKKPPGGITPADIYYRRLLWLLVFGLIDANLLLWSGDVLYVYAAAGLILYPFRRLSARQLLWITAIALFIGTGIGTAQRFKQHYKRVNGEIALALEKQKVKLTEKQQEHLKAWKSYQEEHAKPAQLKKAKKEVENFQQGYFGIMQHVYGFNREFQALSVYTMFYWDLLLFFFLGMALYKAGVLTGGRPPSFYWKLMLIGYGLGLPFTYFILRQFLAMHFDFSLWVQYLGGVEWYQVKRILLTMGHLSLLMLLYKYRVAQGFLRAMAAVGQMAFTNYLMQSIICGFIFYGCGLRWFGALERYELYYVVAGVWVFQIIFSNIWLQYYRFGPLEWVWRSLTYWKKQPFRKLSRPVFAELG